MSIKSQANEIEDLNADTLKLLKLCMEELASEKCDLDVVENTLYAAFSNAENIRRLI